MEEDQIKVPQALALLESGEIHDPLHFSPLSDENGDIRGQAQDDLSQYIIEPYNIPCNGTLIIKNSKTGEFEAIPVKNYFLISKQFTNHEFTPHQKTDTADLVNQFGSRQARRIYSLRQETSKT